MKGLSIEQKAKAYDEAIEKLRSLHDDYDTVSTLIDVKEELENIFPELKENEDEIRKAVIDAVETLSDNPLKVKMLAWLEKQGEHAKFRDSIQVGDKVTRNQDGVLVNLSQLNRVAKKDEKQGEQKSNFKVGDIIKRPKSRVTYKVTNIDDYGFQLDGGHWFKLDRKSEFEHVEQKPAWSEEDKEMIDETLYFIKEYQQSNRCKDENGMQNSVSCEHWLNKLKSLRPQSTWKPSKEQIEALEHFVRSIGESGYASPYDNNTKLLYSLLFDLKKLKK